MPRPLSPHLQIYRPQITSVLSIGHRLSGIFLVFGLLAVVAWLAAAATGERAYSCVQAFFVSPLGMVMFVGWIAALFFHFFCGCRHLIWDCGKMLSVEQVVLSGWVIVGATAVATLMSLVLLF